MADATAWLFVVCLAMLSLTLVGLSQLRSRLCVLSRMEAKLDLLLKHAGLEYDPFADLPQAVIEALKRGQKIQAIKHYRAATGAGLAEAKEFVEELQRRASVRRTGSRTG